MSHRRAELRRRLEHQLFTILARSRATVDDMERDYAAPPPHPAPRPAELGALKRHLHLTATLLPHTSNLDDPRWGPASKQYERSWSELQGLVPALPAQ